MADGTQTSSADTSVEPAAEATDDGGSETTTVEESPTDDATSEAASDEARFVLRGELPLTTADVNALIDFIEEDTGRPFLRPPVIVAQTTEAFVDGLKEDLDEFREEADITVRALQSLGLTTQGVGEVTEAFATLLTSPEGIQGYYDTDTDELYVPIDALADDEFRSLLVHELTHALDGQHNNLAIIDDLVDEAEVTGNYEPVIALQAVVEGRATSVQNRWMAANGVTPEVPDDLGAIEDVPPVMVLSLSLPYAFGEQFIEANGGAAETWDLVATPPPSSENFMVFGGVPAGEAIIDVATPEADGPVLDEAVYGAADIFTWLLGESLEPAPELIFPAFTAIDGWAGGKAVLWGDDVESCTRIALAADSEPDLNELRDAIDPWVQAGPNRSSTIEGDLLVVTGCAAYVP